MKKRSASTLWCRMISAMGLSMSGVLGATMRSISMSERYVPTTDQVENGFAHDLEAKYHNPVDYGAYVESNRRAFRRWLAKRDAEVAAKAWSEGWTARASRGYAHLKVGECVPPPAHINPYRKAVQS